MKRVRENSFAAWRDGRTELFSEREQQVLTAVKHLGACTDREILQHLGYVDMNAPPATRSAVSARWERISRRAM